MARGVYCHALSVPFNGQVVDRQTFQVALQSRLEELIEANPDLAKRTMGDSPEYDPDLSQIATMGQHQDWPAQIMMCDQMMILLNGIDYRQGQSVGVPQNEMPSLQELLEQV